MSEYYQEIKLKNVIFIALLLSLLTALSVLRLTDIFWGLHHLSFVADQIVFILAASLLCAVSVLWNEKYRRLLPGFQRLAGPWLPVLALLAGLIFWAFRSNAAFLGDGNLFLNELKDGNLIYPSNQADYLLHARFYLDVLAPLGFAPQASYAFLSALAGAAFVFLVLKKSDALGNCGKAGACFLLTSGFMMIFFGYVESYAFYYVFTAGYLLFALEFLQGRGTGRAVNVFLVLAMLFHQTGVFLIPSYVFVLF